MTEAKMMGAIRHYDKETRKGYIVGHDGKRYTFSVTDCCDGKELAIDSTVEFDVVGTSARQVSLVTLLTPKSQQH